LRAGLGAACRSENGYIIDFTGTTLVSGANAIRRFAFNPTALSWSNKESTNWNFVLETAQNARMTKIQKIEKEVKSLSPKELTEFRDWFREFDAEVWDAQLEADARTGKLDRLADEALEQHGRGESKVL
jgi:hypothetical protein